MATINGTNNNDTLYGTAVNDTIFGREGHDLIQGGYGADTLDGGDGYDTASYTESSTGVAVNLLTGRGFYGSAESDALISIEGLDGSSYDDSLLGNAQYNELRGNGGHDYLDGGDGGGFLDGGDGNDQLVGGGGDDYLLGGNDDDRFRSGAGADSLIGGAGIDTADYSDSSVGVLVSLQVNLGIHGDAAGDTYDGIENLTGSLHSDELVGNGWANEIIGGNGDDSLVGRDGDDDLFGGTGNDTLDGGNGRDDMAGGLGNDLYFVDHADDRITEHAGEGVDTVLASVSYTLGNNLGNLVLDANAGAIDGDGNAGDNRIEGNNSDNILSGRGGADTLIGRDGFDIANYEDSEQAVSVSLDGSISATGDAFGDSFNSVEGLGGTDFSDVLVGDGNVNLVCGWGGNDMISGGGGRDTLDGGEGDDTYVADVYNEIIVETDGLKRNAILATNGDDLVNFTGDAGTFVLAANIERLTLSHATASTNGTGNDLINTIIGNAGNNILDGKALRDVLRGLSGNDTYFVDSAIDTVIEAGGTAAGTADRVFFTGTTKQTYALTANVENLTLLGAATSGGAGNALANTITGNAAANTLSGAAGRDKLYGRSGADKLNGGTGNDVLTGGADNDKFVFNTTLNPSTNRDIITDFSNGASNNDTIQLQNAVFSKLTESGRLDARFFEIGTRADDANDYIIYNRAKGALYYDADGNGSGAAIQFATITDHTRLSSADFFVI